MKKIGGRTRGHDASWVPYQALQRDIIPSRLEGVGPRKICKNHSKTRLDLQSCEICCYYPDSESIHSSASGSWMYSVPVPIVGNNDRYIELYSLVMNFVQNLG